MSTWRIPLPFFCAFFLALVLGYLAGRLVTAQSMQDTPLTIVDDSRPRVPVMRIDGREQDTIVGSVEGDVRILLDATGIPVQDGRFRIPLSSVKTIQTVIIPPGMQFVASKNGTKYYPVTAKEAEKLVPQNRVYFRNREEAEAAGYVQ